MLLTYTLSIFVSALLLFSVQPLVGRLLLPVLGGSPAIWNTCMVFFQAALLLGYLYAHGLTKLKNAKVQVAIHVALLLAATLMLPIALPADVTPPAEGNPVWWLCGRLALTCGLPFLMLSASAPLLQGWFGSTTHPSAKDPYFLYAASNAGSMASLLAYPFIVERQLGLTMQSKAWAIGFACFIVLALLCGIFFAKYIRERSALSPSLTNHAGIEDKPVTWATRLSWLMLSAVPSSLLVGCSQFLTTDVAAFPLFWVIPLAVYLLTFIIAFSPRAPKWLGWSVLAIPLGVATIVLYVRTKNDPNLPIAWAFTVHGLMLFAGALACHVKLAQQRPSVRHLTEYFVMLSLGGVIGGAFNSLAAPVLFNDIYEYPIVLALAWLLGMPAGVPWSRLTGPLPNWSTIATRLAVGVLVLWVLLAYQQRRGAVTGFKTVYQERSFFGVLRVLVSDTGKTRHLLHGTTNHGSQFLGPDGKSIPSTYYHPASPLGDVFKHRFLDPEFKKIAVIGLGTGAIASYGQGEFTKAAGFPIDRPQQVMHYYEIDPAVERIAKDDRFFTFLKGSKAQLAFARGDARAVLERSGETDYDLIVVDAFSSDAIPIHLITKEAAELYLSRLRPNGILLFHVSNRHLELTNPLGHIAKSLGAQSVLRHLSIKDAHPADRAEGLSPSTWVAIVKDIKALGDLVSPTGEPSDEHPWLHYSPRDGVLWTDEYADVLDAVVW